MLNARQSCVRLCMPEDLLMRRMALCLHNRPTVTGPRIVAWKQSRSFSPARRISRYRCFQSIINLKSIVASDLIHRITAKWARFRQNLVKYMAEYFIYYLGF